jgi:hypothetical protein
MNATGMVSGVMRGDSANILSDRANVKSEEQASVIRYN